MIFSTLNFEMPSFCAVVGCGSRGNRDKNSFFRIPCIPIKGQPEMIALKTERRMKWILALRRKDLTETKLKYASICDRHFISGRPAATRDIYNPDWVPTQNMGYDTTSKNGNQTTTKAIICYLTPCNLQHGEKETVDSEVIHKDENSLSKSEHFFDQQTDKNEMQEKSKEAIICYVKASNPEETQDRRTGFIATHIKENCSVHRSLICTQDKQTVSEIVDHRSDS